MQIFQHLEGGLCAEDVALDSRLCVDASKIDPLVWSSAAVSLTWATLWSVVGGAAQRGRIISELDTPQSVISKGIWLTQWSFHYGLNNGWPFLLSFFKNAYRNQPVTSSKCESFISLKLIRLYISDKHPTLKWWVGWWIQFVQFEETHSFFFGCLRKVMGICCIFCNIKLDLSLSFLFL